MIEIANWVIDYDPDIDVNQIMSEHYHHAGVSLFNAVCCMEKTDGFSKEAHLKLVRKLLNMGGYNQRNEWRFYSWERPLSNTSPLEEQLRVKFYHECITGSHIPQTPLFHACEKGHIEVALELCQVFPVSVNDINGYYNKAVIRSYNYLFPHSQNKPSPGGYEMITHFSSLINESLKKIVEHGVFMNTILMGTLNISEPLHKGSKSNGRTRRGSAGLWKLDISNDNSKAKDILEKIACYADVLMGARYTNTMEFLNNNCRYQQEMYQAYTYNHIAPISVYQ